MIAKAKSGVSQTPNTFDQKPLQDFIVAKGPTLYLIFPVIVIVISAMFTF